jgi:MerR family transcriptional regulator, redox-sensitive transcriptional activator SoxR
MARLADHITIGELSARSGVAPSALRFYEQRGLIRSERTTGNQRRYARSQLRRVAFVRAAQQVGLSIEEIRAAMHTLPENRTPTKADWARMSRDWQDRLDAQIRDLERLKTRLTGCIGCGCLSLRRCALSNPDDVAATRGPGAVYLRDEP